MKVFDWERFWIDHPKQQLLLNNQKWANLRPNSYDYEKAFGEINKVLTIQKTDKVLEVGCGTGEMLPLIRDFVNSPSQIAAVDFSEIMAEEARVNNPGLFITKAPAHLMQFHDDTFDKVFSSGVIQHIATPFFEVSINEMLRVTKVGGFLFIGDVLEAADASAEVFTYPQAVWEQFGKVEFTKSGFEGRLNVLIQKTAEVAQTSDVTKGGRWGIMEN